MDDISRLPHANDPQTQADDAIVQSLFKSTSNRQTSQNIASLLIPGIIFLALNLPFVDGILKNLTASSDIVYLLIKTLLFIVILWLAQLWMV